MVGWVNKPTVQVGDTFTTTNCGIVTVLAYATSKSITVAFDDGTVVVTNSAQLRNGKLHNPSMKLPARRQRLSHEEAIAALVEVHGGRFDYSQASYTTYHEKIKIICEEHGMFEQRYADHRDGKACPSCLTCGYNTMLQGTLYILEADNIVKIGITNRDVSVRLGQVRKSSQKPFTVLKTYALDGDFCSDLETHLLKLLRKQYRNPITKYDGSTESFENVDKVWLLDYIESYLRRWDCLMNDSFSAPAVSSNS